MKKTSFSEEKEAKRLLSCFHGAAVPQALPQRVKVFWFFFSKKNKSSSSLLCYIL
jgi:hypothetical protein